MRFSEQNDYESILKDWYNGLQEPPQMVTLVFTFIKKKPYNKIFMLSGIENLIKYVNKVDFLSLYVLERSARGVVGCKVIQNKVLCVVNRVNTGDVVNRCGHVLLLSSDEGGKIKTRAGCIIGKDSL